MNKPAPVSLRSLLAQVDEREEVDDIDGAEALLDQLVARAPELNLAWYRRGRLRLFDRQAYADALLDLTRAEALDLPANGVPKHQLDYVIGEALFGLERYEEASGRLTLAAQAAVAEGEDQVLLAEIQYRRAECADELEREEELRDALGAFLESCEAFLQSGGDEAQVAWARERLSELGKHP